MKKLVNAPDKVALESLEGMCLAFPQYVRRIPGIQAVARVDSPRPGKVAVVTGGGSGHEPLFAGYVGRGMADASVAGNIFASPPPAPIAQTGRDVDSGAGILFIYGNYSGDVLNFDEASEILEGENHAVRTVRVTDDVASAAAEYREERRGIAGDFFVIKVAGASAETGASLDKVTETAMLANDNTRTIGVALSSCIIPSSGEPIFHLPDNQMEIGMGIHGEPGIERGELKKADIVAEQMLRKILEDLTPKTGSEMAVLVNGLGATPLGELFIMYRAVHRLLLAQGFPICRSYVGNYASSLEMAGCSISLMRLDDQLKGFLLAPAATPAFVQIKES